MSARPYLLTGRSKPLKLPWKPLMMRVVPGITIMPTAQCKERGLVVEEELSFGDLFYRLSKSKFRSRFHLKENDKEYIQNRGMKTIREHGYDFISKRLAPPVIPNDGKQTPMKGHPVFIAQHATACCCRECLWKWHGIPKGRGLTPDEIKYILDVICAWIEGEMK